MKKTAPQQMSHLQQQIDGALKDGQKPLSREDVENIVTKVISSLGGDLNAGDLKMYQELRALALFIQKAKSEIAAIRPENISGAHIPSATDELDAVVGATEDATNRIMDSCDQIMNLAASLEPDVNAQMMDLINRIFEACSFQDITGQRIGKVVRTLKQIETQVHALLAAFGEDMQERLKEAKPIEDQREGDARLLNGPQLASEAKSQAEIDKIMEGF